MPFAENFPRQIQTVKNSAEQILKKTKDLFKPLTTAKGPKAYPLSSYTFFLVPQKMSSQKGKAFKKFLNWYLDKGQSFCEKLHYISLPLSVVQKVQNKVRSIKVIDNDKKK